MSNYSREGDADLCQITVLTAMRPFVNHKLVLYENIPVCYIA